MSKTVEISASEYVRLLTVDEKMDRLEAGGVDNWEWYDVSMNPEGVPSMSEVEEDLKTEYLTENKGGDYV